MSELIETKDIGEPTFEYCQLTTSVGDKLDLLPVLQEIVLYEDIFSPVLTGYIRIRDSQNLYDRIGFSGLEKFTLKFWSDSYRDEDPVNYIHRTFTVLKLTDFIDINEFTKEYSLWFASPEFLKNELIKVSKAWLNTSGSKVIYSLMTGSFESDEVSGLPPEGLEFPTETSGFNTIPHTSPFLVESFREGWVKKEDSDDSVELFVEKTLYEEPVISTVYKKPFDIINSVAATSTRACPGKEATGQKQRFSNFLFFENKRGFQFISLDSLLENKYINTTKLRYGSAEQNRPSETRSLQYETIQELEISKMFDVIQNIRAGMYASKLYGFDISTGVVNEFDYDILENYNTVESTEVSDPKYPGFVLDSAGKNDLLTRSFLQKRMFIVNSPTATQSNITGEQTQRLNIANPLSGSAEYLQSRMSALARLSNFQLLFKLAGNTKHKVGDCIELDIKTPIPNAVTEAMNSDFIEESSKYYSGNYLLTSIKHILTKDRYTMVCEACKDAHKAKFGPEQGN